MCTMYMPDACVKVRDCVAFSVTGITDDYKLPFGCWGINPDPLQEKQAHLNSASSVQHLVLDSFF